MSSVHTKTNVQVSQEGNTTETTTAVEQTGLRSALEIRCKGEKMLLPLTLKVGKDGASPSEHLDKQSRMVDLM